jgi:hypothetical protein
MTNLQLKTDFHKLIDSFEDEQILQMVYEVLAGYVADNEQVDILNDLSTQQQTRLQDSIEQIKKGQIVSHQTVKDQLKKWLIK